MKSRWIVIAILLLLILGIVFVGYSLLKPRGGTPQGQTGASNLFGGFGAVGGNTPANGKPVVHIRGTDGVTYTVPDFTSGKQADVMAAGTYYHLTNNIDTEGDAAQFEIQYGTDNSISIVLVKEPLGASRLAAEKTLRTFFPLPDASLCKLDVFVAVPAGVNEAFAGQNLGLSFCPGATTLP